MKILTVCRAGLVRSVSLMDVLKLHFEPTDVLAAGIDFNSTGTLTDLFKWADKIIVMEDRYRLRIPEEYEQKILVCEVGPDTYGTPKHPTLIEKVWNWARDNQSVIGIKEHKNVL